LTVAAFPIALSSSLWQDQPTAQTPVALDISLDEHKCLAHNIYFEARNQSVKGQLAVGLVTLNRAKSNKWPQNICDVVKQARRVTPDRRVCQFSWVCMRGKKTPTEEEAYQTAKEIAWQLLTRKNIDFTTGATHFHTDKVRPVWAKSLKRVEKIGDHIFYKVK